MISHEAARADKTAESESLLMHESAKKSDTEVHTGPLDSAVDGSDQTTWSDQTTDRTRRDLANTVAFTSESTEIPDSTFQVYGIRWFGLFQLVLLNIIVSWDWLSFSAVANSAAQYYGTSTSIINWLSTGFFFAFVAASPVTIWSLRRGGPRLAILIASSLLLLGNWLRYAGASARSHPSFGVTMLGQILIGFAQPFVLSAPTHYSDLWFRPQGRISATAVMSLANPLGGALGQLIGPFWASDASGIPDMVLYVSIIATIACVPSFFVPAKPPTPVSGSSIHTDLSFREALRHLKTHLTFWLIVIPFWTYVGFFNSISSLLTQMLTPYGFTETEAGIGGALLIVVGLIASAITAPIADRTKTDLLFIKVFVPTIALAYLAFIWAPTSPNIVAAYVILSVLGAASFSLVPIALEFLVEVTYPIAPGITSTVCWTGGQFCGAIFILISDSLKAGQNAVPPQNMSRALRFQGILAMLVVPSALLVGYFRPVERARRLATQAHER